MTQEKPGKNSKRSLRGILRRVGKWTWRNLELLLAMCGGIGTGVYGLAAPGSQGAVTNALSIILGVTGFGLARSRDENHELASLVSTLNEKLGLGATGPFMKSYEVLWHEMAQGVDAARRVWVLSATGDLLINAYYNKLTRLLENGGALRVMLLDPSCTAAETAERLFVRPSRDTVANGGGIICRSIEMSTLRLKHGHEIWGEGRFDWKFLDHIPFWSLVIFDPHQAHACVYVHLYVFQADKNLARSFCLTRRDDPESFHFFVEQYEKLWEVARRPDASR